jgi:hypothetical protein
MDPLRCKAGEAGAFHPLCEALQTIRAKVICASVSFRERRRDRSRFRRCVSGRAPLSSPENSGQSGGLNSLFGHASLRIPLRLVS